MLYRILVSVITICPLLCAIPAHARMEMIGDDQLAGITAQSGLSIFTDIKSTLTLGNIKFSDTDAPPHWIELQGFTIDDGFGGPFNATTASDSPITFDVVTLPSGKTVVVITDSSQTQPRYYSAQSIVFAGQPVGSLRVGPVNMGPSTIYLGGHANGGEGVDFQYSTKLDIGSLQYTYNTLPSAFTLSGVHLSATGTAADDGAPETPAAWNMKGDFKVGDMAPLTYNPATFDVSTSTTSGKTSIYMNLPMQGSLRIEDVNFGGTSFGPIALDGINVHRLAVGFTP
ncbi:MAG: DUF6160 family protein [Geobacteraceae bacterium]